jgi:hypothetical protein
MRLAYVGITGYTTKEQVTRDVALWDQEATYRKLMVGVLMSRWSLCGKGTSFHPNRYPPMDTVKDLFLANSRCLNLVHYFTPSKAFSDELKRGRDLAGPNFHGFQLNLAWPHPHEVQAFMDYCPEALIILQLGDAAMRELDYDPKSIMQRLMEYRQEGLIAGALFDPSGGQGKGMDEKFAIAVLHQFLEYSDPDMVFGVAGGLSGRNLRIVIPPLLDMVPRLSWDAEGQVRDADDNMDTDETAIYLNESMAELTSRI